MLRISLLVALVPILFANISFGQKMIAKGTLTANAFFQYGIGTAENVQSTTTKFKISDFDMNPSGSYFILDDFGVGGGVSVSMNKEKNETTGQEINSFGVSYGPSVRYYLAEGPFLQGGIRLGTRTSETLLNGTTQNKVKHKESGWKLGVGYSIRITDTVLLDLIPQYYVTRLKNSDFNETINRSQFGFVVGFSIILISK